MSPADVILIVVAIALMVVVARLSRTISAAKSGQALAGAVVIFSAAVLIAAGAAIGAALKIHNIAGAASLFSAGPILLGCFALIVGTVMLATKSTDK